MKNVELQKAALWKLMAESLDLEHEEAGIYIGKCPLCFIQDYFGISTRAGYCYCRNCKFETYSLPLLMSRLRTASLAG